MQTKQIYTEKILQFSVSEVTARAAAGIPGIRPDSALLFYRKIRQAIAY
ncbi:IS1595 family transposase, partial [Neisseria iguanae]